MTYRVIAYIHAWEELNYDSPTEDFTAESYEEAQKLAEELRNDDLTYDRVEVLDPE